MAFELDIIDENDNHYPNSYWVVKACGFDDIAPIPNARCVIRAYKDKAKYESAVNDPYAPLKGKVRLTSNPALISDTERAYSVTGEEYTMLRYAALNAAQTNFDMIQAAYNKALNTKDIGYPPPEGAEDLRVSFFLSAKIV